MIKSRIFPRYSQVGGGGGAGIYIDWCIIQAEANFAYIHLERYTGQGDFLP